jgi:phage terminase large subunit GpA-like protein
MPRRKSLATAAAQQVLPDVEVDPSETDEQREWLRQQFQALPVKLDRLTPSEWAEKKRYLPPSATGLPGYYRFDVTPYHREIIDCLDVDSPIREISVMKGVQLGLTTLLENAIGYFIDYVKTAPVMLITADAELAKLRVDSYIIPMLQFSDLKHLIKSSDEGNARKSGQTEKKIEWYGGGFLVPFGAKNANKLRSVSIQILLRDEIDGWPLSVVEAGGKAGDPIKISADRTAGTYDASRKVFDISTPLEKGTSKIEKRFKEGDQRYYFVRCLKCNYAQVLRWRHENKQTGEVTGMYWETENDVLIPESVRYLCQECGHPHTNEDKTRLFDPKNGAEWRPTAVPADPLRRSYHLSALYSPATMQSWASLVQKWLAAWDVKRNRAKDIEQLKVFYNNVLGEPFEMVGDKVRMSAVSLHKRMAYHFGQVPNKWASAHCGSQVLFLTCTVDVHKESLKVSVFGWCRGRRGVLVDYWRFPEKPDQVGNCEQLDDPLTWGALRRVIEEKEYVADDGARYRITTTLIDSGYLTDQVYRFCGEYDGGVFPVKGREAPPKGATIREFSTFNTPNGLTAYLVTVDFYKDRWSAALRREWDGMGIQPEGMFNAPIDITDAQLKELTVETKRPRQTKTGEQEAGFQWVRPAGAANELWDLLVYANLAHDLLAWDFCKNELKLESTNFVAFYDRCEGGLFFIQSGQS